MMRKILLSLIAVMGVLFSGLAQNRMVSGTVVDDSGNPIVGAAVVVDGTNNGVTTNVDGRFALSAPANGKLNISYLGYESKSVAVNNQTSINVTLNENIKAIDDVVVVAFGTTKKEAFTGSASVMKSDDIAKTQTSNITNALAGAVPGITLATSSGQPGSQPNVIIRGLGSISSSNEPLWVVDGQPYYGDLSLINPNDIESMTVLKDAASTSLYGSSGANGVIMVTTKRGKAGEATISFDAKWGVNSRAVQKYEYIDNPAAYYETLYGGIYDYYLNGYNDGRGLARHVAHGVAKHKLEQRSGYLVYDVPQGQYFIGTNGKINPNATLGRHYTGTDGKEYLVTPDDWEDAAFKTSLRQEYNLSASAASDRGHFYASFGYLNDQGIVENSYMERLTARLKADYQVKKWLKIGASASYAHYNSQGVYEEASTSSTSTSNLFGIVTQVAPIYPLYVRDGQGNIMKDQYGFTAYDFGTSFPGLRRPVMNDSNAVATNLLDIESKTDGNAFSGDAFAEFAFLKDFTFRFNAGMNLDEYRGTSLTNRYYGGYSDMNGIVYKSHGRLFSYNIQQLLNYTKTINDVHHLNVMVGHEFTKYTQSSLSGNKSNLFADDYLELSGAVIMGSTSSGELGYNKEGWFGRAEYNYDDRYVANFMYRRDGSSRFAKDHRWGNFWAVSAAWVINREKWFNAPWVDILKLKASYGTQGNDGIGSFMYTDRSTISVAGSDLAIQFYAKGNPDITWETNASTNVGVDFSFWKGRLAGSVEYYYRKTTDMLFSLPAPPSMGYSSYYANIGDMHNAGIELDLQGVLMRTKNFEWDMHLNLSHYKNTIDKLPSELIETNNGYQNGYYWMAEGKPLYSWYLKSSAGVDPDTGEALYWKQDTETKEWSTTTNYSNASYREIGKSAIPDVNGGFGTTLRFYGVDVSINFTYQIGGWAMDYGYYRTMSSPSGASAGYNIHRDILKSWTPERPNSEIPRFRYQDLYTAGYTDRFLTDASYLNLQNINVGYTFPAKWMKKASIQSLRVYLACENVCYWSRRQGFGPRKSFNGVTNDKLYSPILTISGGFTITF
ncbi:MAG: TonB-dependent receptor [Alistipes sp.]|nr:TonB-dependent receptor [Alistipes sp.]